MLRMIQSAFASVVFFCLSPVYRLLQRLVWTITGVQASRDAAASGSYERSVHVQKVLWGKKLTHMKPCDSSEFLTIHERFDHPKILRDPSISLYSLTLTEAIFLKTDKKVDIYSSDTHPFMKWAQAENAEMVYTIPIGAFHQLADEVGDPTTPIIWISSIGRCGSTILGQVFEKIPGTISLGEPDAVSSLTFQNKGEKISRMEARRLLRSVIRLQCKTIPGAQRIVLKVAAFTFAEVKDIYEMFPMIKHIFLYRDTIPYAKSTKTLIESEFQGRIMKIMCNWLSTMKKGVYREAVRIDRDDHFIEDYAVTLTFVGLWVVLAASIIKRYIEYWNEGIPMFAILYEDLIAQKEEMVRKIFKKLDIPEKNVQLALSAFDMDSQRGSTLSRKSSNARKDLTPRELSEANEVLVRYGFPKCDERINVPGRIQPD